jgi:hypothetical protein
MIQLSYATADTRYWSLDFDEMSAEKQQQIEHLEAELDTKTRIA